MLIFGIDKFMSECRALVNFYGNAVATLVIAKWDKTLDIDRARRVLGARTTPELPAADETVRIAADRNARAAMVPAGEAGLPSVDSAKSLESAMR